MKTLGNILWFVFGGLLLWFEWVIAGALLCVTLVGIPLGLQCFKIAKLCVTPFKKEIKRESSGCGGILLNILWIAVFGWEIALTSLLTGVLWCVTIIGIPFGKQFFKLAELSLFPFGANVVRE